MLQRHNLNWVSAHWCEFYLRRSELCEPFTISLYIFFFESSDSALSITLITTKRQCRVFKRSTKLILYFIFFDHISHHQTNRSIQFPQLSNQVVLLNFCCCYFRECTDIIVTPCFIYTYTQLLFNKFHFFCLKHNKIYFSTVRICISY